MATKTTNLNLILPSNNEYYNSWDVPLNKNFSTIDEAIGSINTELAEARGAQQTLDERLSVALDQDGNLLPTPEVEAARSSTVYGAFEVGGDAFDLGARIEQGDVEAFTARQGLSALIDAAAWANDETPHNSIVSAASNYLTFTGAVVSLNGSVTPCIANINGYRQVVRTIKTTTISGASGTYYLTLNRQAGGTTYLTVTANTGNLGTFANNGLIAKLSDNTKDFVALGVKAGDVLELTAPSGNPNLGKYVVLGTNTDFPSDLTVSEIAVYGQFSNASTGMNYTITDPIAPSLSFTSTAHPKTFTRASDKIYIGRCVFDGSNVTSLTTYASQGIYKGFTSIALSGGSYNVTISHNLGYFPKSVRIFASQASDFSQPLEPLSTADISGGGSLQRSCIAQVSDTTIQIKNPTNGLFYKDFGGTSQTTGYLYVVVER